LITPRTDVSKLLQKLNWAEQGPSVQEESFVPLAPNSQWLGRLESYISFSLQRAFARPGMRTWLIRISQRHRHNRFSSHFNSTAASRGPWFHHERSIESLKPRASRARSIGGRIRVVKRLEIQRAEACYDSRLKPAAG